MARKKLKTTGSPEPLPGKCGARLSGSDPPRYCTRPSKDGLRCGRFGHNNGLSVRGRGNPNFRTGKYMQPIADVLPAALARHFDPARAREADACAQQLLVVDARMRQVLESIKEHDPTGGIVGTRAALGLLRLALELRSDDSVVAIAARAVAAVETLELLLDQQAADASGWNELHRLFDSHAKLSGAHVRNLRMLNDMVLVGDIKTFMQALITEARTLTSDPSALGAYARRVIELGGWMVPSLASRGSDMVEGEVVEERKMDGGDEEGTKG